VGLRQAGRWLVLLGLLATACQPAPSRVPLATASGSPPAVTEGGTFTEAVAGIAGYLNPLFADEDNAREIDALVYQGLTQVGPDQQVQPLLAREIRLSADRLTYSILLRTDVRWADGLPFTAEDVRFTFSVLQDPGYTLPEAANWKGVVVKKVADDQVDFTLKSPSAGFLNSLRVGIIPQHLFPGDVATIPSSPYSGAKAIGTGPFMVDSISGDRSVVTLRRNPYAAPAPHLDRFVFKGYSSLQDAVAAVAGGVADAVGGVLSAGEAKLLDRTDISIHDMPTFSFTSVFLDLDPKRPYFSNPTVRRALSQAIDRKALVRDVLRGAGDPQATSLPPSEWAYSAAAGERVQYDPGAAERALDGAGWTVSAQDLYRSQGGVDFIVELVVADAYPYRDVARVLQRQLATVGVGVRVNIVPAGQLVHQVPRSAHLPDGAGQPRQRARPGPIQLLALEREGVPAQLLRPAQPVVHRQGPRGRPGGGRDEGPDRRLRRGSRTCSSTRRRRCSSYSPHYQYAVNRRVGGVHANPVIDAVDRFQYVTDWFVAG